LRGGPDEGRSFPLTPCTVVSIGRGPTSHTHLVDLHVSRLHCEIRWQGGRVAVTDNKSAGGTFVNGQRISSQELRPGDVIRIGETELRFESTVAAETTLPPPAPLVPKLEFGNQGAAAKEVVFANKPGGRVLPKALRD